MSAPPGYRIERVLGEGKSARVHLAVHEVSGRRVALKILHEALAEDEVARHHFHREAQALMNIEHMNVVSVYDYSGKDADQPFLVSELLEGVTVLELVQARGVVSAPVALAIFGQALGGLAAAHAGGLVHRDLSLSNIFITETGRVVVTDFGLVVSPEAREGTFASHKTGIIGTPLYFAPEILSGGEASARTDIYAVGVGLVYALAGKPPVPTTDMAKLLRAILDGAVQTAAEAMPLDRYLARAVAQLVATDPNARFASAAAAQRSLAALLAETRDEAEIVADFLGGEATQRLKVMRDHATKILRAVADGDETEALALSTEGLYRIGDKLGEGAMGKVFRAQRHGGGDVAIKALAAGAAENTRMRMHREARALGRIAHPNVIRLLDFATAAAPLPFLVFELIAGATVEQILEISVLPERVAIAVSLCIARALRAAHEANVVHRDLKPENVFVAPSGRVVLADFGIARGLDSGGTLAARTGTAAVGSPLFASPEQIFAPERVTTASDLFSLGGFTQALLTGHSPFESATLTEIFDRIERGEAAPLPDSVSVPLAALIRELMQTDPAARPESAAAVEARLQALLGRADPHTVVREFVGPGDNNLVTRITRVTQVNALTQVGGRTETADKTAMVSRTAIGKRSETQVTAVGGLTAVAALPVASERRRVWPVVAALFATAGVVATWFVLRPEDTAEPVVPVAALPASAPSAAVPGSAPVAALPAPVTPPPVNAVPAPTVPAAPVADRRPARVQFFTTPWARITVDGKVQGTTPMFHSLELAPGRHQIRFDNPAWKSQERTVSVKPGEPLDLHVTLEK